MPVCSCVVCLIHGYCVLFIRPSIMPLSSAVFLDMALPQVLCMPNEDWESFSEEQFNAAAENSQMPSSSSTGTQVPSSLGLEGLWESPEMLQVVMAALVSLTKKLDQRLAQHVHSDKPEHLSKQGEMRWKQSDSLRRREQALVQGLNSAVKSILVQQVLQLQGEFCYAGPRNDQDLMHDNTPVLVVSCLNGQARLCAQRSSWPDCCSAPPLYTCLHWPAFQMYNLICWTASC